MPPRRSSRIQILTLDEVDELYRRPEFNQAEREEFFALDEQAIKLIRKMDKLESRIYFILFIGYFRSNPVIPLFHSKEAKQDARYICQTYFSGTKPQYTILAKATRSRLVNQAIHFLGFESLTSSSAMLLEARLQDVATIYNNPRYIFDECLSFLGQQRIALPAYTSLQDFVTQAISSERQRTEDVLSKNMSRKTVRSLQSIMKDKGFLSGLSGYQGSARGFTPSELDRELRTHETIKVIYPELKRLLDALDLSRGNMLYYGVLRPIHRKVPRNRNFTLISLR